MLHICIECSQKTSDSYRQQLMVIKNFLERKGIRRASDEAIKYLNNSELLRLFDERQKCHYGISCPVLEQNYYTRKRLAKEITPLIMEYILVQSRKHDGNIGELLRLLGEYFPREYRAVERIYHKLSHSLICK